MTTHLDRSAPGEDVEALLSDAACALTCDGDLRAGRQAFETAYEAAERAGDASAMAVAAAGIGGLWVNEHRTAADGARLQARLLHALSIVDSQSTVGLELRVMLAAQADYCVGGHDAILQAVNEARLAGDPAVRVKALSLAHDCLLGPDHGELRRALAAELVGESFATRRHGDLLVAMLWQTIDLFLDGDARAERRLSELRDLLAQSDHLAVGFVVSAIEVMLTIRAGNFELAGTLAQASAERGTTAGDVDATEWHAAQLVAIRWYQGRLDELLPMLTDLAHSPTLSAVDNSLFAALALAAAEAGDRRTASGALARLHGRDLADLPRSTSWLVTMHCIVEAAHLVGDDVMSARAYELLSPYADLPMMVSVGAACFGSAHHALGVASLTTGHVDRAVTHLHAAIRQNLALGHWPAVVTSRRRYAEALARRGDSDAARVEVEAAARDAAAMGMPVSTGDDEPTGPAACTRHGHKWRVDLGQRSVLIEHSVGMLHLANLIASPGQEIAAVDLMAGMATLTGAADAARASRQRVLDRAAVHEYRERLARLRVEIDELDARNEPQRAARARAERDWLMAELTRAAGLGGRARGFTDSGERARIAAGRSIRRAMSRIAAADAQIGEHLRNAVHTGVRCSYRPG